MREVRRSKFKVRRRGRAALTALALLCACRAKFDSLQVVLDRHADAVARLPEEERIRLLPFDEAVSTPQVETLLPTDVLTLENARSLAVRANPDVHAAQARLQAAAARIGEARSRYYPSVVYTYDFARTFQTPASRNRLNTLLQPTPSVPSDVNTNNLAITAILNALRRPLFGSGGAKGDNNPFTENSTALTFTWTVFDGLVREANILSAKHLHQASKDSLVDVQRLILKAVDAAYFQVQLAQEQLRIARADETFGEEQYRETQKLQAAGRATSADADNFRIRVLGAKADVTAAEGLRETGRIALAELMGLPDLGLPPTLPLSLLLEESETELAGVDAEPWVEKGLTGRPDIRQLEQLVQSEAENVRAARRLHNPSIVASGSWGFDRSSSVHFDENDQSSAAALEFRWDLFTGGAIEAKIRGAESNRAEAAARFNRMKLAVQSEVRRAVIDLTNAQTRIRLHRETVATALENRRIVLAGYLAGKETLTRLNEAQRDYITADADLALSRIRLRQSWSDLRTAAAAQELPNPPSGL